MERIMTRGENETGKNLEYTIRVLNMSIECNFEKPYII